MAQVQESSLLFSLNSLIQHERARVEHEAAAAEESRRHAEDARVAAERRAAAERARLAAEERERTAAAERRRRDEEARLEGIRQAEIERAHAEARLRSELELAAARGQHELRLAAAKATSQARAARGALLATSVAAVVSTAAVFWIWFGVHRPDLALLDGRMRDAVASERGRAEGLQARLADSDRERAKLGAELARSVAAANAANEFAAQATRSGRPRPAPPPAGRHQATGRPARPCGDPNDPLNPCL